MDSAACELQGNSPATAQLGTGHRSSHAQESCDASPADDGTLVRNCFQGSLLPPGTAPCAEDDTLNQVYGLYQTHTQYGYLAFRLSPVQRVEMRLGYSVVDNQGNTTQFNSLLPLGPLASTYQSPLAGVDFLVYQDLTFKAGWNYYQYNEDSFVGPTLPRYFHANNTTLALRYAF